MKHCFSKFVVDLQYQWRIQEDSVVDTPFPFNFQNEKEQWKKMKKKSDEKIIERRLHFLFLDTSARINIFYPIFLSPQPKPFENFLNLCPLHGG